MHIHRSAFVACIVAGALALGVSTGCGVFSPRTSKLSLIGPHLGRYEAERLESLASVPDAVRRAVMSHLTERLGDKFAGELQFTYGTRIDREKLYQLEPHFRDAKWPIFSYKLVFWFSRAEIGIRRYEAEICVDDRGGVIQEIDLPAVAAHSEKARLISRSEAVRIAKKAKFRVDQVRLEYLRDPDAVVWIMVHRDEKDTEWHLIINAHTGDVLDRVGFTPIY